MSRDRGLLTGTSRSDCLSLATNRVKPIANVCLHGFVVVLGKRNLHWLARSYVRWNQLGRGETVREGFQIEVQVLAADDLDSALIAHELLTETIMLVSEIAAIEDLEI